MPLSDSTWNQTPVVIFSDYCCSQDIFRIETTKILLHKKIGNLFNKKGISTQKAIISSFTDQRKNWNLNFKKKSAAASLCQELKIKTRKPPCPTARILAALSLESRMWTFIAIFFRKDTFQMNTIQCEQIIIWEPNPFIITYVSINILFIFQRTVSFHQAIYWCWMWISNGNL